MLKIAAKTEPNFENLQILYKLGYENVEIFTDNNIITDKYSISLLKNFPFEYVVHAPCDTFDQYTLDFATEIGAKLINTHKVVTNDWLNVLTKKAKENDIIVTVENEGFPSTKENTEEEIKTYGAIRSAGNFKQLKERVPDIYLCCDIEHACIKKEYPWMLYACKDNLKHIHLSGWSDKKRRYHQPVYRNEKLLTEVLTMLSIIDYDGFVVCEHATRYNIPYIWREELETINDILKKKQGEIKKKKKMFNKLFK